MEKKALIAGVVLTLLSLAGRLMPRVVTGISLMSVAQALGMGLLFWVLVRRRREVRSWIRSAPAGKHILVAATVILLVLTAELVGAVAREIRLGIHYDRVEKDLAREDPAAALNLAVHLTGEESAPLRKRIIRRIGELGNPAPRVTSSLREVIRADPDRGVREMAARSLGGIIPLDEVVDAIVELPHLELETRGLFLEVLTSRTGAENGEDPAAWRGWLVDTWAGAKGEEAFRLAIRVWRAFPAHPTVRQACLARIADPTDIARQTLQALLRDENPILRSAAARSIAATGDDAWVSALSEALSREQEGDPARAVVEALAALDPEASIRKLLRVVRTATGGAGKEAALDFLSERLTGGESRDVAEFFARHYGRLSRGGEKSGVLDDLVRLAASSETARSHLLRIARDDAETAMNRGTALRGVLKNDSELLSDLDLVALLEDPPDIPFAQSAAAELRRRTGQDGGRDPDAWREILGE